MDENEEQIEKLSPQLRADAVELMDEFRKKMLNAATEVLRTAYTDYLPHVETDAWVNYRELLRKEMTGGWFMRTNDTIEGRWARQVREMILKEHRASLIVEMNQDSLVRIDELNSEIEYLKKNHFKP